MKTIIVSFATLALIVFSSCSESSDSKSRRKLVRSQGESYTDRIREEESPSRESSREGDYRDSLSYFQNDEPRKLAVTANNGLTTPLAPQAGNTYDASNIVDGNTATAWAVDMNEQEVGPIWGPNIIFKNGTHVDYIVIYNGYTKNQKSFKNNSRPAWITIYRPIAPDTGNPGEEDILYEGRLSDTMSPQRLNINPRFDSSRPVDGVCLKFRPPRDSVGYYFGDKWAKDMLVSEMEFWGH